MAHHALKLFVAASIILLAACKGKPKEATKAAGPPPPQAVDVLIAQSSTLSEKIEANGSIVANESTQIIPEVSGRLVYLNIPEGKIVQKGTVLARINSADLQANLGKARAALSLAQSNEQRLKKLLAVEGVNQADYDAVANQVSALQADIQYSQALIDKSVIRAPFTGKIGLRMVSPGAIVNNTTVLATLQQFNSQVKVDFTLPESYASLLKTGQPVTVVVNAGQPDTLQATISAIEPQTNLTTRNLLVRALLPGSTIQPGTFVKVMISTGETRGIMVPTNAIIPEASGKKLVVVKEGKASMVTVQTGIRKASQVEITSGLSQGDSVVVNGVLFARPGAPLKVRKVTAQAAQAPAG